MKNIFSLTSLLVFIGLVVAFESTVLNASTDTREEITVPIAVYILVSEDESMSSQRTIDSIEKHFKAVNHIWRQADIVMQPVVKRTVVAPEDLLVGLSHRRGRGGLADFFQAIRSGRIDLGASGGRTMQAFYVRSLGGPNGLKPIGRSALFVADDTSVSSARVTSHEIGHNLGLYHVRNDPGRLLSSGSNGVTLTDEEQTVARYNAKQLLWSWSVKSFE